MASPISLPGLQLHYPHEARRLFPSISGTDPYNFRLPEPTCIRRQVEPGFFHIPATPLIVSIETKNHGLFWCWKRLDLRLSPVEGYGPDTRQPGHLIWSSHRHLKTYPTVRYPPCEKWFMRGEIPNKGGLYDGKQR